MACYAAADPATPVAVYRIAVDYNCFEDDVPPTCSVEGGFYRPRDYLWLAPGSANASRAEGLREFLSRNGMWLVTDPESIR